MGRGPIQTRKLVNRSLLSPPTRRSKVSCCISPPFGRLSTTSGKVTHVLLTRAPLYRGRSPFSCDLHVLGAPLTFALSQDQTLQFVSVAPRTPFRSCGKPNHRAKPGCQTCCSVKHRSTLASRPCRLGVDLLRLARGARNALDRPRPETPVKGFRSFCDQV